VHNVVLDFGRGWRSRAWGVFVKVDGNSRIVLRQLNVGKQVKHWWTCARVHDEAPRVSRPLGPRRDVVHLRPGKPRRDVGWVCSRVCSCNDGAQILVGGRGIEAVPHIGAVARNVEQMLIDVDWNLFESVQTRASISDELGKGLRVLVNKAKRSVIACCTWCSHTKD
jgi:hypothetical protein